MKEMFYFRAEDIVNFFDELENTLETYPINVESEVQEHLLRQAMKTVEDCRKSILELPVYVLEEVEE